MAHPAVLPRPVGEYETLRALHAQDGGAEARHRLGDVAYTLCVATGASPSCSTAGRSNAPSAGS